MARAEMAKAFGIGLEEHVTNLPVGHGDEHGGDRAPIQEGDDRRLPVQRVLGVFESRRAVLRGERVDRGVGSGRMPEADETTPAS
jgi:hypothetical protein